MAVSGPTGLQPIHQAKPDLVMLDINIPGMSGPEILEVLKEKKQYPIIVITSHGSEPLILKSFRLGAKEFIQKPFVPEDVLNAIDDALAEAHWQKERKRMATALSESNRKLQRQVEIWETLNKIGRDIAATLNANDAQRRLMRGVNRLVQVETGSLYLVDTSTGELVLEVSIRGDIERQSEIRLQSGQGIAGWVLEHGQSVLIPDS